MAKRPENEVYINKGKEAKKCRNKKNNIK